MAGSGGIVYICTGIRALIDVWKFNFNNLITFNIMKMKKIFLTSAVALALLSGCNNDYDGQDIAGSKLVVSASIDQVNTRVSNTGTEWETGDEIGVSDNLSNPNLNIKYVAGSTTGNFTSETGIYILGDEEVTYTAYYPYAGNETASAGEQGFKIVDAEGKYVGHSAVDFMFATGTATRSNPQVNLQFKHKMSKVSLDIKDSNAAATKAETPISYTLQGVIIDGTFNTETGEITPGSTKGNVTVDATLGTASSIILPPMAAEATEEEKTIQLLIKIGDKAYAGELTPALGSSQEYQYSIDLSQTTEGSKLKIDSPTMEGWTPNNEGNLLVKEEVVYNTTLEVGDFFCKDGTIIDKDYDFEKLEAEMKESIVGVVFHLGNSQPSGLYSYNEDIDILKKEHPSCTSGLVYAIKRANVTSGNFGTSRPAAGADGTEWYAAYETSFITTTSNKDRILGYNYTRLFEAYAEDDAEVGAGACSVMKATLDAYRTNTAVSSATTGWYLPSMGELNIIKTVEETLNASLAKVDGAEQLWADTDMDNKVGYWSSSLRRRDAVLSYVNGLESPDDTVGYFTSNKHFYRFVLAF